LQGKAQRSLIQALCGLAVPRSLIRAEEGPFKLLQLLREAPAKAAAQAAKPVRAGEAGAGAGAGGGMGLVSYDEQGRKELLTAQNVQACKALFNVAHSLGHALGHCWLLVLEALSTLDTLLTTLRLISPASASAPPFQHTSTTSSASPVSKSSLGSSSAFSRKASDPSLAPSSSSSSSSAPGGMGWADASSYAFPPPTDTHLLAHALRHLWGATALLQNEVSNARAKHTKHTKQTKHTEHTISRHTSNTFLLWPCACLHEGAVGCLRLCQ